MTQTPQLRILTIDSTGNADEIPLETLLELLVAKMPAPSAPPSVPPVLWKRWTSASSPPNTP